MNGYQNHGTAQAAFLAELAREHESDPDVFGAVTAFMTDCPVCGDRYEALTREEAASPNRLCWNCWKIARSGAQSGFTAVVRGMAVDAGGAKVKP